MLSRQNSLVEEICADQEEFRMIDLLLPLKFPLGMIGWLLSRLWLVWRDKRCLHVPSSS